MTADFDRTAHCQYNHQCLTEIQRILTEHFWLCFDRTTFLTEHFGKFGFDRTVNRKMFCQKDALLGVFCHIEYIQFVTRIIVGEGVVVVNLRTNYWLNILSSCVSVSLLQCYSVMCDR